eukprot:6491534-Amphidinium_carterae.2
MPGVWSLLVCCVATVAVADSHDDHCEHSMDVNMTMPATQEHSRGYWMIGETKGRIPEASEPTATSMCTDGGDGDVQFPHGNLKPIATVGECISPEFCINGVPDGNGAMLKDDATLRIISQSESYGPISNFESVPWHVNSNGASYTGSHIQYVDYDREKMASFMTSSLPASDMVVGAGDVVETAYNLKGEMVGARNRNGPTTTGAHYSNTDAAGNYVIVREPSAADWIMQSLCSAHLEEKHQWGAGIGVEDDMFITNEEWITLAPDVDFTGLASHVVDLANKTSYAAGVFTLGGFEKIVEVSTGTTDYVAFVPSGYNGAWFSQKILDARNSGYTRSDGNPYVGSENVVPSRLYIGKKGYNAQGQPDTSSFLARNGLAYGQLYGFAVNATGFETRDAWHRMHYNGDTMEGGFYPISWRWDGTVQNFEHDGSWEFQDDPVNGDGMQFWNSGGRDSAGAKTEHVSPDPHDGLGFWQGSTAGYIGKYNIAQITSMLQGLGAEEHFPTHVPSTYTLLQGETDIVDLIDLNGKGQTSSDVGDQTQNCDGGPDNCKTTFEDVDGMEAFAVGDKTYIMIQEDSGNDYGERMFITEVSFDRGTSTANKVFKFVAQSGGSSNTRMNTPCSVGVPEATWGGSGSHEFSGLTDISGLLRKEGGSFALQASDTGYEKRQQDKLVTDVNDKVILVGLQAHNLVSGDIRRFGADRGGQWLLFQPQL